ncbi:MAG TPA: alpha/beta fold hydrolase, partial [Solirubrobacteraceae bacterium]|nr:alpha/beta fold hydrolase [Solirubrobacteraceae bacterium]
PGAPVPDVLVDDLVRTGHRRWAGSTAAIDAYLAARPLADRLRVLGLPVDVLFGERDQRVDPASLRVYDAVPRATVRTLPGLGHSPLLEAPDTIADALHHALAQP